MESTADLAALLADLLRREHGALADFLLALADFDREERWRQLGHASLFGFLHRDLGLSKSQAFYRMTAAQLVRRNPEVVAPIRDGLLCLSTVVELAGVAETRPLAEVLPRFFRLSKQEAKAVAAELCPATAIPAREVVTAVRGRTAGPAPVEAAPAPFPTANPGRVPQVLLEEPLSVNQAALEDAATGTAFLCLAVPARDEPSGRGEVPRPHSPPVLVATPPVPDEIQPLTAELRRFHLTVSRRFLGKLKDAKDLLSNASPAATSEEVLEAALDLLLERRSRQRGHGAKPREPKRKAGPPAQPTASTATSASLADGAKASPNAAGAAWTPARTDGPEAKDSAPGGARIPNDVKRAVWRRDGGCCQWPLAGGGICGSRRRVQFDHPEPRARGGQPTVANVRLLCRFHNDEAARLAFGDAWMDRFTRAVPRSDAAVEVG